LDANGVTIIYSKAHGLGRSEDFLGFVKRREEGGGEGRKGEERRGEERRGEERRGEERRGGEERREEADSMFFTFTVPENSFA
jgi:hypothetical protein